MNQLTVTMPDGSVLPLAEATFQTRWNVDTSLDGQVVDLGIAYRSLLTYLQWATQKIERLQTELADLKAQRDRMEAR